ncbi:MAG: pseudouridine synthase family protein, partial [Myxococcaceae bacterium]|nr:pseudouridine synthase family protein [Myxococcaceae bacterium]
RRSLNFSPVVTSVEGLSFRSLISSFSMIDFTRDGAPFAVLRCFPRTGRQHQIRIHLQQAGFPLVGDKMYGFDPGFFDRFSKHALEPEAWVKLRLPRHALHAAKITFEHPGTGQPVSFESPLPEDLRAFAED